MILIPPGSRGVAKGFALAADHDFAAGDFGEERASAALADQFVDIRDQIDGQDDVGSAMECLGHTPSVTYFVPTWKGLKSL